MDEEQQLAGGAVLRRARPGDEAGIVACIRALAEYEKEPDAVQTTPGDLRQALFASSPSVFAHVIEKEQRIIAIAVWFLNYSTWTGRNGVYLEDLFVREDERRHGYGRTLLAALARVCAERGYGRARVGLSWTGTSPPSASIAPLAPSAWMSGPSSASPATPSPSSPPADDTHGQALTISARSVCGGPCRSRRACSGVVRPGEPLG